MLKSIIRKLVPVRIKRRLQEMLGIAELQRALEAQRRAYEQPDLFRVENLTVQETTATAAGNGIRVRITPQATYPFTYFRMETSSGVFDEPLLYSHLGLAKLVTEYEFSNVLEIGSRNGTAARAFEFLGKKVQTIEILEAFAAGLTGDYLDAQFPTPFDAIWCSHVLEHQRHPGRFCEKMFDDLREGGILAITMPTALSKLMIGHCNIFTPLHLLYHLILAGFDCSAARLKCYDSQMTVLIRKKSNGLPRISFATTYFPPHIQGKPEIGSEPKLRDYFPSEIAAKFSADGIVWGEIESINWE